MKTPTIGNWRGRKNKSSTREIPINSLEKRNDSPSENLKHIEEKLPKNQKGKSITQFILI